MLSQLFARTSGSNPNPNPQIALANPWNCKTYTVWFHHTYKYGRAVFVVGTLFVCGS